MKKLLTVLALIAFSGSVFAASGWSKFTSSVNNGFAKVTQAEQNLNTRRAEAQAKVDAQKKAAQETKNAVDNEVSFWKNLFKRK